MAEKNGLFREKPLESVNSPESLNEYLKVTSPGVWIVVIAVMCIIAGAVVWGCLGHIEATETVPVVSDEDGTYCLVGKDLLETVAERPEVAVEGERIRLIPGASDPVTVSKDTDVFVLMAGDLEAGDVVYRIKAAEDMKKGVYEGRIVTEEITPISFLLN